MITNQITNVLSENLKLPEKGLAELRRIYLGSGSLSSAEYNYISSCAAYFGDFDFALDAMKKGLDIEASGQWMKWLPVMKEFRQTSRFKEFVREIGLVDYWEQFGWPDLCHPTDNGDFVCD